MKSKLLAIAFLAGMFLIPKISHAESINTFNSAIKINQDSSITVEETIVYDFTDVPHHGIFRDIPYHYQARGGNYNLGISVQSVTDDTGSPYPYTTTKIGDNVEIKIGDPNITVTGVHTYNLNYTVKGAINYFSDHDELYWNVTGNAWPVSITRSVNQINLPTGISTTTLQTACFAGPTGSTQPCASINNQPDASGQVGQINFSQGALNPYEGFTIVVGFPKGLVHQPTLWENIFQAIKDNLILLLPILTLIAMWLLKRKTGSDAGKVSTVVAQYEAPADLTPTEVGALMDESANNKDVSAEIINLAVKGYLKITRLQEKVLLFNVTDYQLDLLKPADEALSAFEKQVVQSLFGGLPTVKLSDLKYRFYQDLPTIQKLILGGLTDKGYLKKNPSNTKGVYTFLGALIIFASIFFGSQFGLYATLAVMASGIIIIIFSRIMSFRTAKGVEAKQYILGLKLYLSVAEKDRLKFTDAPDKTPDRFEKLLPYAMVLGVEQDWAKQFEGIYNQPPRWYYSPMGGPFNSLIFINNLHEFNNSASTTLASSPRGASGGGSGFGGGGFSGGGFGGGGGGSW